MSLRCVEPVLDSVGPGAQPTIDALANDGTGGPVNNRRAIDVRHYSALLHAVEKGNESRQMAAVYHSRGERRAFERARGDGSRRFVGAGELLDCPGRVLYVGDTSKRGLQLTHGGAEAGVRCFARIVWQITVSGIAAG